MYRILFHLCEPVLYLLLSISFHHGLSYLRLDSNYCLQVVQFISSVSFCLSVGTIPLVILEYT
ncbi:hypothetical protein F5878DRAFT_198332 [Lentinula raphanica]|uniref:Uncharacterized protein n=1 Tax=Lentinula raphanica TaxID=153919 RepID=A0AA38P853_9AGAR|nr:hypothetical protein F5878DRAFT_198332 [Lentinula raphanica]